MTNRKPSIGAQILEGLREAIAFERGEVQAAVHRVPVTARDAAAAPAPGYTGERIAELRGRLRLSQVVFAQALNVSPETVRAWEQSKRAPEGAALRLLQITEEHPQVVLQRVQGRGPAVPPRPRRQTATRKAG